jgi:hypothetical protein
MIHGSVVASYTVEEFGPDRLARVSAEDINVRYNRFQELTSFEAVPAPESATRGVRLT